MRLWKQIATSFGSTCRIRTQSASTCDHLMKRRRAIASSRLRHVSELLLLLRIEARHWYVQKMCVVKGERSTSRPTTRQQIPSGIWSVTYWSLYCYGQTSYQPTKQKLAAQVPRTSAAGSPPWKCSTYWTIFGRLPWARRLVCVVHTRRSSKLCNHTGWTL